VKHNVLKVYDQVKRKDPHSYGKPIGKRDVIEQSPVVFLSHYCYTYRQDRKQDPYQDITKNDYPEVA
jgi:hypothetical protein